MQVAPCSIPTTGTFFRGDFVLKKFLWPFSLFRWFKNSSCQLLAKECAGSTGKLPRRLAQEQCGKGNWPLSKWPEMCWRAVKKKSNQKHLLWMCSQCLKSSHCYALHLFCWLGGFLGGKNTILLKGCFRWKNMGVFEGKTLYFCRGGGRDGGGWLFFNPVGGFLSQKCNSVGGCPSQKCSSVGIRHSTGILWVVEVKNTKKNEKKTIPLL